MARSVGGMSGRGKREDMLPPLKRHEIQVLRRAGHSQAEVARLAAVSVRTVRRVDEESSVVEVDARKQVEARGVGRPSKTEPLRAFVLDMLDKEPELMSLEVLRRARLRGYGGSKSAMYQLIAEVRPKQVKPVVRFEGLPGEFSQHDFGEVEVRFVDGRRKRVVFFASRLEYSRWVQVTIVPDQQVESLVRTLVEHFETIGGVPLAAVFDRARNELTVQARRLCSSISPTSFLVRRADDVSRGDFRHRFTAAYATVTRAATAMGSIASALGRRSVSAKEDAIRSRVSLPVLHDCVGGCLDGLRQRME